MNPREHIILINGIDRTQQIKRIEPIGNKFVIEFTKSDRAYYYNRDKVIWLNKPVEINLENSRVFINGECVSHVKAIIAFIRYATTYYAVEFENGFIKHVNGNELEIHPSCLSGKAISIFEYFKLCAGINTLGTEDNNDDADSKGILSSIYSKIDYIDDRTVAAVYLNPKRGIKSHKIDTPIFPFGCNSSQRRAVKAALTNQLSVIQGPPGTGKTQTILNIIANLLINRKTVLIVSNNNSATENISEKLKKNGFDFLVAPLGKRENKEAFVANQPTLNPDLQLWHKSDEEIAAIYNTVRDSLERIENIFKMQERLATLRQELDEVTVEQMHFEHENPVDKEQPVTRLHSDKVLNLLNLLKSLAASHNNYNLTLWNRIKNAIWRLFIKIRLRKIEVNLSAESLPAMLTSVEKLFYINKIAELRDEISALETELARLDANSLMKSLTEESMTMLKAYLSQYFNRERNLITSLSDLYYHGDSVLKDYPIVLSTTFSSKTCFSNNTIFDYVIMDEASQVGADTGLLSLTCAKNAVIVGDTMQLPNVITEEEALKLCEIKKAYDIPDSYDTSKHSFLSSVLASVRDVPETLLREHYRCHPDIINFCNQKFYGGNLLIMTNRHDGDQPLLAITTAEGHHSRGHYNQREIDSIKLELLPQLKDLSDVGIITPYNRQANAFHTQMPDIEAATVHKYQGREKSIIILSVTDDVITEFTDNANLLNVAVSRAKDMFCIVVSGNSQELKGNIHDLLGYIRYRHNAVSESRLHSIYDYLFTHVTDKERQSKTISEYDSENLTFNLIEKIRKTVPRLSHIKALCHYPLRSLIKDTSGLTAREKAYAGHPSTHIDFLIINRVSKEPLLAIETDGYSYHNETTEQFKRDRLKDHILELYGIPLLRLSTIGHSEEQRIIDALTRGV